MATAPDPVQVAPEFYKARLDNDRVRVLDVQMPAGQKSSMHSHPAYVIYVVTPGKVKFTAPDGTTEEVELEAGQVIWREAETHAAENVGTTEVHVLNIELK